ncbi:MAG: glycerol-3-phosphate acyltransferase [Chloroflexota bacterium]|nr:glycerol-3-phosphate acyltransferase [Chloroflexota bacterium]
MSTEIALIQSLLASIVVGYLLGSIPLAHLAARRRGIDIFNTGSTRAGTANVFWNISRKNGILVFAGDAFKGLLAVKIASLLGVPDNALIIAGGAAVAGHWKSIFTRFRGGDGMVTLAGVTLALTPVLFLMGIAVGVATVYVSRRSAFRSSLGITACFGLLLIVSQTLPYFYADRLFVLELSVLALLVIFHNVLIHRMSATAVEELRQKPDDDSDLEDFPEAGLEPDLPEKT